MEPKPAHSLKGSLPRENPRTVWITGVSGTLGTALAHAFLRKGDRVVGIWNKTSPALHSDLFKAVQCDLHSCDENKLRELATTLPSLWQTPAVLLLNAGINENRLVAQTTPEQWDSIMQVNLKSAFQWIRHFTSDRSPQHISHLIAISSYAARHGHAGQSAYVASKAALIGLIQTSARELARLGVCCNAVFPGVMESEMTRNLTEEQRLTLVEDNLLGRLSSPAEVAAFVVHLTSMRQVSGQVFQLDSRIAPWT